MKEWLRIWVPILMTVPFLLVLATVFVESSNLANGIVTGKWFWFFAAMIPVVFVTILSLFSNPTQRFRFTISDGCILLFALSIFIFTPKTDEISQKQSLLSLIICLYFYFRVWIGTQKTAGFILSIFFILTGLVESLYGLFQLYGWENSHHNLFRITGSFLNPGPYSGYVAMTVPMALHYVISDRKCLKYKFTKRFIGFYLRWGISASALITALLVLPAAMSRAAWVGLLCGCCLVIAGYFKQSKQYQTYFQQHKKHIQIGIILLGSIFVLALVGMYYLKKDSADGRALIWKISLPMILEHPCGVGVGHFSGSYGDAQAEYFASGKATEREEYVAGNPEYAFNEYLQVCIELGIIPFILFMTIVFYSLFVGFRRKQIAASGSLLTLLLFAGMSYPFSVLPFLIGLVFLLAATQTKPFQNSTQQLGMSIHRKIYSVILLASVFICFLCLKTIYPTYKAYKDWNKAKLGYNVGLYNDASIAFAKEYHMLSDQVTFLFEYAQSLSKTNRFKESNEVLERATRISCDPMFYNIMGKNYQAMKNYPEAEKYFLKAAHIVPNRIYPYFLLANMYEESKQKEKAENMARIVLTKEPKIDSQAIKEMKQKMKQLLRK